MLKDRGFTLFEVVVAIAVLGIGIAMVMQLFSGGLRSGRASQDYTLGVILAREKMEETLIEPVEGSGEFDNGYRWQADVASYGSSEEDLNLLEIKVRVSWPDSNKERSVELVTLRVAPDEKLD